MAKGKPAHDPVDVAKRAGRVVELRRQRLGWKQIAETLGCSVGTAWNDYQRMIAEAPAQHVDEHRAEELMLIDDAIADLMGIARDEAHVSARSRIEAWSSIRGWAERKAKLLGLDAPTQVVTIDKVDQEIAALQRELAAMDQVAQAEQDAQDAEKADAEAVE
jgi:hypothetical protein